MAFRQFLRRAEGFVFDLDGTLVDTFPDIMTAVNLVRADCGLPPLELETVTGYVGHGVRQLIRQAMGEYPESEETRLVNEFRRYYREHIDDRSRLYPGVLDGLSRLKDRHLAVLSNKPADACRELLTRLGIADRFEIICGQDSFSAPKPDPAGLLSIIGDVFGIEGDRALMVGDFDTDVLTARNAGVRCAVVRTGMYRMISVEPDWYINDIAELSCQT